MQVLVDEDRAGKGSSRSSRLDDFLSHSRPENGVEYFEKYGKCDKIFENVD